MTEWNRYGGKRKILPNTGKQNYTASDHIGTKLTLLLIAIVDSVSCLHLTTMTFVLHTFSARRCLLITFVVVVFLLIHPSLIYVS